jgi:Cu/Zn superoxide dismutase
VKKLVALLIVVAVGATAAAALAAAHSTTWSAALSSAQEVPKQVVKDTAAHGQFTGTLTGSKLKWTLTFSKLTGRATAAHIHMGGMHVSGPVVVPLCGPCKSPVSGTATLSAKLIAAFKKHDLYVNVHTAKNPNGEIRGQLAAG